MIPVINTSPVPVDLTSGRMLGIGETAEIPEGLAHEAGLIASGQLTILPGAPPAGTQELASAAAAEPLTLGQQDDAVRPTPVGPPPAPDPATPPQAPADHSAPSEHPRSSRPARQGTTSRKDS